MTMKFELSRLARNCTNEEIIAEVKRVGSLIKKDVMSQDVFNEYAKVSSSTARKRFGSWKKVLIAAGLDHRYADRPEFKKARSRKLTDEEIIVELQRIAKIIEKESITIDDFMTNSSIEMHPESVRRRFGSWPALLEKAGLKLSPKYHRRYSNEEYFENLLNLWTYHGRQPVYREIDEYPSTISSGAYEGRFGSWRKALEAFVTRMNEDETENREEANTEKTIPQFIDILEPKKEPKRKKIIPRGETRRGINLSLRYKVLIRDKFRCVRCGRSPATTPGVELQIDHKNPFSNQGKTLLENLETKCKECNLGKGDRHIE
jgi:hypothetical protein